MNIATDEWIILLLMKNGPYLKKNLMYWKFLNINLARKILEKISLN